MEVCAECGSTLDYRNVDVTTMTDSSRVYEKMAWRCSNPSCENHNPAYHTFEWTKDV
jgi:hypothetical protein